MMVNLENGHNLEFVRETLKQTTREILISLTNDGEASEVFETAGVWSGIVSTMIRPSAKAFVAQEAPVVTVARFMAS